MAMETNAFNSTAAAGNKEDISDVIYNVDPFECPFLTSIDDVKADNKLHQWQTDALAAAYYAVSASSGCSQVAL